MMEMKYVVINTDQIIVFSAGMRHSDFKAMGNITSAGFVGLCNVSKSRPSGLYTYGKSTSLGIGSVPEDQWLLDYNFKRE